MKLIDFIEAFDMIGIDYTCVLMEDPYVSDEKFREHGYEYDEVFRGELDDIPICYGNEYVVPHETFIDFDKKIIEIYVRNRAQ